MSSYEVGTTLAGGKSAAVGYGLHGPGVPLFGVAHEFVSGTEGKALPEEIDPGMLPPTRLGIEVGTTVYPGADSFDPVEVDGGTWRFVGWDADSAVMADPGVIFTGTWVFEPSEEPEPTPEPTPEPDPLYSASYVFVSGTEGKGLPAAVLDLLPAPVHDLADGSTVAADPSAFDRVDVDGGYWEFAGWDADALTVDGCDVRFTGTWVFVASVPMVPLEPADPVEPGPIPDPEEPAPAPEPSEEPDPAPALPQTGDASALAVCGVGGAGAALSALGAYLTKKRRF